MNEHLLQYVWNYKIFNNFDFKDVEGHDLEIIDFGKWNHDSGPDFLMAKIKTNNLVLAGNIEVHIKSSDWILHQHSENPNYENVVLHVVYFHDVEVEDLKNRNIPTLEIKNYIRPEVLMKYQVLSQGNQFIACEKIFDVEKIPFGFSEETLLKKLDNKSNLIEIDLKKNRNNYEAVLFHHLAYAFGLKINAEIFKEIVESIDFNVVQKIAQHQYQLEALLFGKSGWLANPLDHQMEMWKTEFDFIQNKFQISDVTIAPKFLRLRPPNFPTIRLSQLAHLYHREKNLFSRILEAKEISEIRRLLDNIKASEYWDNHFNFGKITNEIEEKKLSKEFVERLIINTILPLKFAYHKNHNENIADEIVSFYEQIPAEKNSIISQWKDLGTQITSSKESQAFLFQYKNFCLAKNCLNCSIGFQLLK